MYATYEHKHTCISLQVVPRPLQVWSGDYWTTMNWVMSLVRVALDLCVLAPADRMEIRWENGICTTCTACRFNHVFHLVKQALHYCYYICLFSASSTCIIYIYCRLLSKLFRSLKFFPGPRLGSLHAFCMNEPYIYVYMHICTSVGLYIRVRVRALHGGGERLKTSH